MNADRVSDVGAGDTIRFVNFSGEVSVQSTAAETLLRLDTDDNGTLDGRLALTGDFNGDGTDDILWRNANGQTAFWEMNEGDETSHGLASVAEDWIIV